LMKFGLIAQLDRAFAF